MTRMREGWNWMVALGLAALACGALPRGARAHCDTMDGPVVGAARRAFEGGEVRPVLKWVREQDEAQVRAAFARAATVRARGPEARALAELWFFETVVRLHRAGEGEPYTGLEPAGTPPEPAVRAADAALDQGSAETLVDMVGGEAARGLRERCARAVERRRHAEDSIEAGRAYVAAYVDFVHYAERLWQEATAGGDRAHAPAPEAHPH